MFTLCYSAADLAGALTTAAMGALAAMVGHAPATALVCVLALAMELAWLLLWRCGGHRGLLAATQSLAIGLSASLLALLLRPALAALPATSVPAWAAPMIGAVGDTSAAQVAVAVGLIAAVSAALVVRACASP